MDQPQAWGAELGVLEGRQQDIHTQAVVDVGHTGHVHVEQA